MSAEVQNESNDPANAAETTENKETGTEQAEKTTAPAAGAPVTVTLKFGYQDKESPGTAHTAVTFGKRATGGDVLRCADRANGSDTQYQLAMVAAAITHFGTLAMPAPLTVLLSLDEIDREQLLAAYFAFMGGADTAAAQEIAPGKARLAFGIERDGVKYDAVEFGKRLTGYDDIEIEAEAGSEAEAVVLKRARRVVKISTADNTKTAAGGLTLAEMNALDYSDFIILKEVGDRWLDSFRAQ